MNLKYRSIPGAADVWKTVAMDPSGSTFSVDVPESDYDMAGIMFYVVAADIEGNSDSTAVQYSMINIPSEQNSLGIASGVSVSSYNMISIPYVLSNNSKGNVFTDFGEGDSTEWRLFSYNSGSQQFNELTYSNSASINRGAGYFLISKTRTDFTVPGGSSPTETPGNEFTINLNQGWNLIGNPYLFNLDWTEILNASGNPTDMPDQLRVINSAGNGYDNTQSLGTFRAAFINSPSATTLTFPLHDANASARKSDAGNSIPYLKNNIDKDNWEVAFNLHSPTLQMPFAGFGMRTDASEERDRYDDFTMPRFKDYLELNYKDLKFVGSSYTRDVVPTHNNYVWNFTVNDSKKGEIVTIDWDNSYFGNKKSLLLIDLDNQVYVNMSTVNTYSFRSNGINNFRIIYTDPENKQWAGLLEPGSDGD